LSETKRAIKGLQTFVGTIGSNQDVPNTKGCNQFIIASNLNSIDIKEKGKCMSTCLIQSKAMTPIFILKIFANSQTNGLWPLLQQHSHFFEHEWNQCNNSITPGIKVAAKIRSLFCAGIDKFSHKVFPHPLTAQTISVHKQPMYYSYFKTGAIDDNKESIINIDEDNSNISTSVIDNNNNNRSTIVTRQTRSRKTPRKRTNQKKAKKRLTAKSRGRTQVSKTASSMKCLGIASDTVLNKVSKSLIASANHRRGRKRL